jgi:mono/diheme cytochrome c family protein
VHHRSIRSFVLVAAGIVGLALACSREEKAAEPAAPPAATTPARAASAPAAPAALAGGDAAATAEATKIFTERCVTCHGPNGAGDGPASAGLTPKPRNFTLAEWQKSVTDEHIEQIIQYGGPAVGLSAAMPANPDLMSKPAVVTALRQHVRSLAK